MSKHSQFEELHACALQLAQERLPPGWELVNSSGFARVACNARRQVYYKEFLSRTPWESLKALFRGSRATRARRNNAALLHAGIGAPQNISWGKLPGGSEYLVTQAVPGQDITQWLREGTASRRGESLRRRRQLLRALGRFIGRVHATGFIHGDLRPGNILACLTDERFQFYLIDNERTVKKTPPPGRALLKNLMQLNMLSPEELSRTDRMRFFCEWREQMRGLTPLEARIVALEAWHWAMRRMYTKGQL